MQYKSFHSHTQKTHPLLIQRLTKLHCETETRYFKELIQGFIIISGILRIGSLRKTNVFNNKLFDYSVHGL